MKAIELTEEHKKKLKEMCKLLFPEYSNIDVWEGGLITDYHYKKEKYVGMPIENINFHWFEFCMTKLISKLNLSSIQLENCFNCSINIEGDPFIHPIDFLYTQFQKLQNDKETKQ